MKAEIKRKWVEALRSGHYDQASQTLFDKEQQAYCCLGVLRSVCRKDGIRLPKGDDEFLKEEPCMKHTGLSFDEQSTLWKMNDDEGQSFAEIADYIERYIPSDAA
jgi:hypothetical protein